MVPSVSPSAGPGLLDVDLISLSPVAADERQARIVMSRVAEPGDPDACALVHRYGALALLDRLAASTTDLPQRLPQSKLGGWTERLGATSAEHILEQAERVQARFVCPGDREWPVQLDDLAVVAGGRGDRRGGAPFGVWIRG